MKLPNKIGGDGGIGSPYIINPYEEHKCICCGKMAELRVGVCWECANCESVIADGTDMYDKPIDQIDGHSIHLSKVRYILKIHGKLGGE